MELFDALADEFGLLDARLFAEAGCTRRQVERLVASGHWIHLARGWYALASAVAPRENESPAERRRREHALLTRALVANFDGRAAASHHSALVLHDLPAFAADLRQVHVTRVADDHSRARRGLTIHQAVVGGQNACGVIAPAVAIAQAGVVNGAMAALVAADAALHREIVTRHQLDEAVHLLGGPRIGAVQRALLHADGRAESPGETRLREAVRMMGFAATPQVVLRDGAFVAVLDLVLNDVLVAIEFDGFVKYGRRNPWTLDATPADIVVAEKIREDHIRSLRYAMVRVIWRDLDHLVVLRRRMMSAVELARTMSAA
jgi:hypothetical protein